MYDVFRTLEIHYPSTVGVDDFKTGPFVNVSMMMQHSWRTERAGNDSRLNYEDPHIVRLSASNQHCHAHYSFEKVQIQGGIETFLHILNAASRVSSFEKKTIWIDLSHVKKDRLQSVKSRNKPGRVISFLVHQTARFCMQIANRGLQETWISTLLSLFFFCPCYPVVSFKRHTLSKYTNALHFATQLSYDCDTPGK